MVRAFVQYGARGVVVIVPALQAPRLQLLDAHDSHEPHGA